MILNTLGTAQAAPVIGSASTVVREVRSLLNQDWRMIVIDANVHQDELIRTGEMSAARLLFADRTDFMIGANAEVVLDKFIYDPSQNSGQLLLRATKGLMKFRTGRMTSKSYRIDTPVATVGVRGTEFVLEVVEGGATFVHVISGEVFVLDRRGKSKSLQPGEKAVVFPPDHARAAEGPILVGSNETTMSPEARQMITQIVFTEDAAQTQLTAQNTATGSVSVSQSVMTYSPPLGQNGPLLKVNAKAPGSVPVQAVPGSNQPLLFDTGTFVPPVSPLSARSIGVINGGFENGLTGWTWTGPGTAAVIADPTTAVNKVLQLTSRSPVSVSQKFITPGVPFLIEFEYLFLDAQGWLEVYLDTVLVHRLAGMPNQTDFAKLVIPVDDAALYGLVDPTFTILLDSALAGATVLIDDVGGQTDTAVVVPGEIPIPPSILMLGSGLFGLAWISARRHRKTLERV